MGNLDDKALTKLSTLTGPTRREHVARACSGPDLYVPVRLLDCMGLQGKTRRKPPFVFFRTPVFRNGHGGLTSLKGLSNPNLVMIIKEKGV